MAIQEVQHLVKQDERASSGHLNHPVDRFSAGRCRFGGGTERRDTGISAKLTSQIDPRRLSSLAGTLNWTTTFESGGLRFRQHKVQGHLRVAPGFLFDASANGRRSALAEKLFCSLADRQQTDNSLFRFNDPTFPLIEMNPKRLGEASHDIKDQREALGLLLSSASSQVAWMRRRSYRVWRDK
jgi:hypothetical protein